MKILKLILMVLILPNLIQAQDYYRNWTVQEDDSKHAIALIIANNHYENNGSLQHPIPTAKRLEVTLTKFGFDVLAGRDLNREQMVDIITDFSKEYENYELALIAYMGHGFEIDGRNYLIPTDANPPSKYDVAVQAIDIDYLLGKVGNALVPKVMVIDACRNNPFESGWSSTERATVDIGFTEINATKNTEIFFSTQKNSVVKDDNPYMSYFISELERGICLDDLKRNVYNLIIAEDNYQVPAIYGQLSNKICFGDDSDKAVELKVVISWHKRGDEFYFGENGKEINYIDALYWFNKAAGQGYGLSEYRIGNIYRYSKGVDEDEDKADYWYKRAANSFEKNEDKLEAEEQIILASLYQHGKGVKENNQTAFYWKLKAAEFGYPPAQASLANDYLKGYDIKEDSIKAEFWYKKAFVGYKKLAESGDVSSMHSLAGSYLGGRGCTKDKGKSIYWYEKAIEKGNLASMRSLGMLYTRNSEKTTENYEKAIYWIGKAAEKGSRDAQYHYGGLFSAYAKDFGIPVDSDKADYWFKKSCDNGYKAGCFIYAMRTKF